ncbi:peroxidase [Microbacterium sp. HMWF026]|nr:peroxidase [Microbacterium sp. HMWF026]PTT23138.1 peroxidase [Microbacterium sp. HMWF026]
MGILSELVSRFRRENVSLELDDIQALILRSRPEPYVGIHAMLHVDDAAGGRDLLRRLEPHISTAAGWAEELDTWTGVAISYPGLEALGVPKASLESFPVAFKAGMAARAHQLRDFGENAPETWEEEYRDGYCHIALTIYARDNDALDGAIARAFRELKSSTGVTLAGTNRFGADEEAKNPFGFRDSISQPTVAGSGLDTVPGQERSIAAGEFILGEDSETGSPLLTPAPDVLGRNGSYIVLRKYASKVGAFNDFLRHHASTDDEQDLLGAKMFGRWRSGAPLVLSPHMDDVELGADPNRNNNFDYADDEAGLACPYASHSRRLNPRYGRTTILADENIHRIIRRSSTFGPKWTRERTAAQDAEIESGIFFIFISARAFDTIEFLQQEWINRGNFIDLGDERDPIVGLHENPGTFTIPTEPVRKRVHEVTTFNRLRGGEYMFMPSLSALRWMAAGEWDGEAQAS